MARILIIDDDDGFRAVLEQMLVAQGHAVTVAADGLEGCRLYGANSIDLILADLVMPHSGLAAIYVLCQRFPGLKVIAMSGGARDCLPYAHSFGAVCTLTKPFTAAQLAAAIEETLRASPPVRSGRAAEGS